MSRFLNVLDEYDEQIPDETCVAHNCWRALKNTTVLKKDFLPTNIACPKRSISGVGDFSLSVFESKECLDNAFEKLPLKVRNKFVAYAIGDTRKDKGIATKPNAQGHINFYLFDWYKNNPYTDFKLAGGEDE